MGVQESLSRSQRSAALSIPRNQGVARIVLPPGSVGIQPQYSLLDTHMSSLPLNGDALLCFPNLVMTRTMDYANNVPRQERLRYLRGLTGVETGMSPENEDESLRMLMGEDGDEGDEALIREVSVELTGPGKGKRMERLSARGEGSDLEDDEVGREMPGQSFIPASLSLPPSSKPPFRRESLAESSRIHGTGLPAQLRQSIGKVTKEDRKRLPPTPAQIAALEHEDGVQGIAIEASSSWRPATLRDAWREFRRNTTVLLDEDKKTDTADLGWPPLQELFANLAEPVRPVLRREFVSSPVQTIWNHHEEPGSVPQHLVEDLNRSWLSQGRQTEEPEEFESKAPSMHSSASDNPSSGPLAEPKLEDSKPRDPSIFISNAFTPILAFLYQEWKTTRLLHRYLRSTFGKSRPGSPPTSTEADAVLTREQCEFRIAVTNECRQHIEELKKWYRNTRKLMELTIEATQSAAAFRFGIEKGDAEQLAMEMLRGGDGSGTAEVPNVEKVCGEI